MDNDTKRDANRQRKAEWREKQRQMKDNAYEPTPIEKAKQFLELMQDPDVNSAYQNEDLAKVLMPEDRKTLNNFVYHLKSRRRKYDEEEAKRTEDEKQISEKGIMFVSQKTFDLHQALLRPMSSTEKETLIKDTIDTNLYLFLEYMENYQSPWNGFLDIIVGLKGFIDKQSFTELFVRVCIYQKIEDLRVSPDMVEDAFNFLVEKKKDDRAAYGLLRIIFINNISLKSFQKTALIRFQEDYEETILRFFKTLSQLDTQVTDSMPGTVFCFTSPILSALRDQGRIFYTQIPYQFLPYVIQITCYSFTENEMSFQKFLDVFKQGMKLYFNDLILFHFQDLLQRILDDTKRMAPKFFGNLDYSTTILERSFALLGQRQIGWFTPKIINDLIDGDQQVLKEMSQRARIIPQNSQMKLKALLKEISAANTHQKLDHHNLQQDLTTASKAYFEAIGIENPLPLQVVAFNLCTSETLLGRWLVLLDTGSGKTALCFTIGCSFASKNQQVLIINSSEELTFRDFKLAEKSSEATKMQVNFLDGSNEVSSLREGITYLSYRTFASLIHKLDIDTIKNVVAILDEFDSTIFGTENSLQEVCSTLPKLAKMIGFSGSELKEFHIKAAENAIRGNLLRMNIKNVFKPPPVIHGMDVYSRVSDYRDVLAALCEQQVEKTPVIIIAEDEKNYLAKKLQRAFIHVEALWQKSFIESNAALTIFTRKQGQRYPVFIINDCQGRGLDFPSTTDIEDNGGVYLIIGKLPPSYLQYKQFLGRTGRIGNKSQYSVLLHDSEAKHEEGPSYLDKMLEILINKDLQRVSSWHNQDLVTSNGLVPGVEEEEKTCTIQIEELSCVQEVLVQHPQLQSEKESDDNQCRDDETKEVKLKEVIETSQSLGQKQVLDPIIEEPMKRRRDQKGEFKRDGMFKKLADPIIRRVEQRDNHFFEGYGQSQIHEEMLADSRRVDAYQIALNKVSQGKVVADVGAGTGVLSIFAAEGGATKVYAIENAQIYKRCKKEVSQKGFQNSIKIMNCLAENAPIDPSEVDVIVSEWMGYFLLFERMLPSVLALRDQCLKPGGIIVPGRVKILLGAASFSEKPQSIIVKDLAGVVTLNPEIIYVKHEEIISTTQEVLSLCLLEAPKGFDSFESDFQLTVIQDCEVNGLVGWFDVEMTEGVWFSTSPYEGDTHWHQTVFPLIEAFSSVNGDILKGNITVRPIADDHRGLQITIVIGTNTGDQRQTLEYFIR